MLLLINQLDVSLSFNFQMAKRGPISRAKEKFHVARALRRGSPRPVQLAAALYSAVLPALELCLRGGKDRRHRLPAADPARRALPAGRQSGTDRKRTSLNSS